MVSVERNGCKEGQTRKRHYLRVEVEEDDDEALLLRALHATTRRKKRDMGPTKLPCKILDDLYLSDAFHVSNPDYLLQLGITHVLNLAAGETNQHIDYESYGIQVLQIQALDSPFYNIMQHYEESAHFYQEVQSLGGKLVVHCKGGINRSSTITLALYMHKTKMPIVQAADHINSQRGPCLWNLSFRKQIVDWARKQNLMGSWQCDPGKQDLASIANLPNPTSPSRRNLPTTNPSPTCPSSPISPNRSSVGYCLAQDAHNTATPYATPRLLSAPVIYG